VAVEIPWSCFRRWGKPRLVMEIRVDQRAGWAAWPPPGVGAVQGPVPTPPLGEALTQASHWRFRSAVAGASSQRGFAAGGNSHSRSAW
jgi:hypothetical protein